MSRAAKGRATDARAGRDATRIFHREWLGLAQPIEGLVFSVPALDEAPAPAARPEITAAIRSLLTPGEPQELPTLRSVRELFRTFLGYDRKGALLDRDALPENVSFYAPESRQQIRPSFALSRGPLANDDDDLFAQFATPDHADGGGTLHTPLPQAGGDGGGTPATGNPPSAAPSQAITAPPLTPPASGRGTEGASPYLALVWDLGDDVPPGTEVTALDLDKPEDITGAWHYPPTAKLERLLRHLNVPVGFVSNRRHLRLVYAPPGEATSHLTFRFEDLVDPAGRPLALALDLIFHARRTYGAKPEHTFEGLLAESRRRQADVTEELAQQVFEAIERLLEGLEAASARDAVGDRPDSLRAAMEAGHVYDGVLNAVLRLVFLLYAEDRSLMPVSHPTYAQHLSVLGLYERLASDAGAHPESMHQRYGAYGALVSLFRAVYFGVHHAFPPPFGPLHLPARQGRLFDPSAFPFLEGGLPEWTAAVNVPEERAQVRLPTLDDGTLYEVLHRLIVLDGQRISYRDLSVEQIGAVYESLMGFTVHRVEGPAVRLGKLGYWVEVAPLRSASKTEQADILDERCDLTKAAAKKATELLDRAKKEKLADDEVADALLELAGKKSERERHRAKAGQLVLQPTASRRSTGSHYTPRSLSEKVVRRTLEPILACLTSDAASGSGRDASRLPLPPAGGGGGRDADDAQPSSQHASGPTVDQILQLKVCDPAMGSGAFLVEACRFLGNAVVEAWRRSGELPAVIEAHGDALLHAKRLVAQKCLYGVDKNAAAVELAKLSLWLETLSGDRPFTFLDHVLRHGDSLVGLDLSQVRAFHWSPDEQLPTVARLVDIALAEVKEHRDAIQRMADEETDAAQKEKRRLYDLANHAMDRVKLVADVCVGAFFAHGKAKDREKEREKRLAVVEGYLAGEESQEAVLREWADVIRKQHAPFHWHLELPEVFFLERPDPLEGGKTNGAAFMDAFVGNPPFLGGKRLSSEHGDAYGDWVSELHSTSKNADLAAHFLRRCFALLGQHGAFGLVATHSISQGDNRKDGLARIVREGGVIIAATGSLPWPGDAQVNVSVVHVACGVIARVAKVILDDEPCIAIDSRLQARVERDDAAALSSNQGLCFSGSYVAGMGFFLSLDEAERLTRGDIRSAERVSEYMGGEELLWSPLQAPTRAVINFGDLDLEQAEQYPALLGIVRAKVKPEREATRLTTGPGGHGKKYWWQYISRCEPLYAAIRRLRRCLVVSQTTRHLCFAWQPTSRVFGHSTYVFASSSATTASVLQSRVHEGWARLLSSSLGGTLRYTPRDCFETFPFPKPDPRTVIPDLEEIGQRLHDTRAAYMVETQQGLTQTYNKLKDPSCTDEPILHLRALHEEMDRAVLAAYGWSDIEVPPFCPLSPADQKALETFQDQVIDRLFILNAERAKEEARLGAAEKKSEPKAKKPKKPKPGATPPDQGSLF